MQWIFLIKGDNEVDNSTILADIGNVDLSFEAIPDAADKNAKRAHWSWGQKRRISLENKKYWL